MTTLRFQSVYETQKSGFRCQLRVSMYRQNTTLKVGDLVPYQRNTTDLYSIKEISNVTNYGSDYDNAYIVVGNSVNSYKVPYKGAFEIKDNNLKECSENYDAHMHRNLKIEKIN